MTNAALHERLTKLLRLSNAPVAIIFRPDGRGDAPAFDLPMSEPTVDGRSGRARAACSFWAYGHESTFSTVPEDHGNCSVGRFTHGFAEAGDIIDKEDVATLLDVGWVTAEAFGGVAKLTEAPATVQYGPLSDAMETPDVVLLRITPRQMMEIGDAVTVQFSGKPQCQVIPLAAQGVIAASMGCALSRERTGMGDDELTCAIPGDRLTEVVEALAKVSQADAAVVGYAVTDKLRFSSHAT